MTNKMKEVYHKVLFQITLENAYKKSIIKQKPKKEYLKSFYVD